MCLPVIPHCVPPFHLVPQLCGSALSSLPRTWCASFSRHPPSHLWAPRPSLLKPVLLSPLPPATSTLQGSQELSYLTLWNTELTFHLRDSFSFRKPSNASGSVSLPLPMPQGHRPLSTQLSGLFQCQPQSSGHPMPLMSDPAIHGLPLASFRHLRYSSQEDRDSLCHLYSPALGT